MCFSETSMQPIIVSVDDTIYKLSEAAPAAMDFESDGDQPNIGNAAQAADEHEEVDDEEEKDGEGVNVADSDCKVESIRPESFVTRLNDDAMIDA